MKEPTFKQHEILVSIRQQEGNGYMTGKEDNIELHWELVREGYLKNLIPFGKYEWKFILTAQAENYLESLI